MPSPQAKYSQYSREEMQQLIYQSTSIRDLMINLGYHTTGGATQGNLKKYLEDNDFDIAFKANDKIDWNEDNIFIKNSQASQKVVRTHYFKGNYTPYKCSICGLPPEWQGKPLVLTLDHINGDNKDDRLENLRWVCPNCDRQLPTFCRGSLEKQEEKKEKMANKQRYCIDCGKPISSNATRCVECSNIYMMKMNLSICKRTDPASKIDGHKVSKEELQNELIKNNGNFTLVGKMYGISDNGLRKWCDKFKISRHPKDYKKLGE